MSTHCDTTRKVACIYPLQVWLEALVACWNILKEDCQPRGNGFAIGPNSTQQNTMYGSSYMRSPRAMSTVLMIPPTSPFPVHSHSGPYVYLGPMFNDVRASSGYMCATAYICIACIIFAMSIDSTNRKRTAYLRINASDILINISLDLVAYVLHGKELFVSSIKRRRVMGINYRIFIVFR